MMHNRRIWAVAAAVLFSAAFAATATDDARKVAGANETNVSSTLAPATSTVTESPVRACSKRLPDIYEDCSLQLHSPKMFRTHDLIRSTICKVALRHCSDGRKIPKCPPTHVNIKYTRKCIKKSDFVDLTIKASRPTSLIYCEDVFEGCRFISVCVFPDDDTFRGFVRRCDITTKCYKNQTLYSETPYCPVGYMFDPVYNLSKCIKEIKPNHNCKDKSRVSKIDQPKCKNAQTKCIKARAYEGGLKDVASRMKDVGMKDEEMQDAVRCATYFLCKYPWDRRPLLPLN